MRKTIFDFATNKTVQTSFTAEDNAMFEAGKTACVRIDEPLTPNKEQLLAELATLTAKIQALA